jgi:hypothetical protein
MLAYTLFQAWGNTPESYEDPNKSKPGAQILEILQKWDTTKSYFVPNEVDIAGPLGLPPPISADVKILFKTVPNHEKLMLETINVSRIIKWHYAITGKNFEILVLDGRTKRGYPDPQNVNASGEEGFEHLHAAMFHEVTFEEQMPSPSPLGNKEITFVIAPTSILSIPAIDLNEFPLLGGAITRCATKSDKTVDFFDHWKNQSEDFEKLLNHIAKRGKIDNSVIKTRNIILTGDVHFAAASRMIYEKKPLVQSTGDPHCQSVFAQLVSSSFKKEEKKTRLVHHQGYKFSDPSGFVQMKVFLEDIPQKINDFIYKKYIPGLSESFLVFVFIVGISLHTFFIILERIWKILDVIDPFDFFEPKLPASRKFFGWKDPAAFGTNVTSIDLRIPDPDPNKIKFEKRLLTTPTMLSLSDAKRVENIQLPEPQWRYRIDYILAENETRIQHTDPILNVNNPAVVSKDKALEEYLKASKNHLDYAQKYGNGKEIVGMNNVSEISFDWKDEEKTVIQQTWWHLKRKDNKEPEFFPLTKYKVSLDFDAASLPSFK